MRHGPERKQFAPSDATGELIGGAVDARPVHSSAAEPAYGAVVHRVVELARTHLHMDIAFVSQFIDGRQIYQTITGEAESFGVTAGNGPFLPNTFCSRVVVGELPNVIPDVAADSRVRYLPITRQAGIGAYVGVPLRLSDGTLYGTLCCLSHDSHRSLTDRDGLYLQLLADLLVDELDREQRLGSDRAMINDVLNRGRIDIAVQPVISLTDGRRLGLEALARFPTEVGSPSHVFAIADRVGLRLELEQLTAGRAMELAPFTAPGEFLSLNMSPASIVAWEVLLNGAAAGGDSLVIEITEHQAIDRYDNVQNALIALRGHGIRIAIDDVGAGYASMHHVLQLNPDFLKIDRKIVGGAADDRGRRSVISGFVSLARDIGATVIGEGVETKADLEVLRELGVDAAQGYLLGRPKVEHPAPRAVDDPWTVDAPATPEPPPPRLPIQRPA